MPLSDEKSAELLLDHHKDTFEHILYHWKARNRLFVYILVVLALTAVDTMSPGQLGAAVNGYLTKTVSASETSQVNLDLAVIGSALWFLLLTLVIQYYQRSIHVDRQFRYIAALEEKARGYGLAFLTREGAAYFSRSGEADTAQGNNDRRPIYLQAVGILYVYVFPVLLTLFVVWRLVIEVASAGLRGPVIFDIVAGAVLTFYNAAYVRWAWAKSPS